MQNHLESSQRSYAMLQADPFGGAASHEYTSLNNHNGSPGTEYGHLLTPGGGGGPNNNGGGHHNNNNHHHGGGGGGAGETPSNVKPKKQPPPNGKKTKGRVKIKMEFIDNKLRRYTTFSKRKTGIMKKAYELSTLTGTQVMLLVASETGHVYTFATRKLQPMITSEAGKALIQTCLNSPDPPIAGDTQRMSATGYEETELTYAADPNTSDHGDKDDDESGGDISSDGDDPGRGDGVPPLLPLNNGLLPPNFAALFASASGLGMTKGGLTLTPASLSTGGVRRSNTTSSEESISICPTTTTMSHSNHNPVSSVNSNNKTTTITIPISLLSTVASSTAPSSSSTSSPSSTSCSPPKKLKRDLSK